MSGKRFTPAPWKRATNLSRNGSGKPRGLSFSRIVDANNQTVAYAYQRASRLEQVGNVNLISAAPEMFKELERLSALFSKNAIYLDEREKIEKIIRKARGESEANND